MGRRCPHCGEPIDVEAEELDYDEDCNPSWPPPGYFKPIKEGPNHEFEQKVIELVLAQRKVRQ